MDSEGRARRRTSTAKPAVPSSFSSSDIKNAAPYSHDDGRTSSRKGGDVPPPSSPAKLSTTTLVLIAMLSLSILWVLLTLSSRLLHASPLDFFPLSLLSGRHRHKHHVGGICAASTFTLILPHHATIENITSVPSNGTFGEGESNLPSPKDPTSLPPLCALIINVTSSPSSSYRFGLFLPQPSAWHSSNRRFLAVGNGGFAGGISWLSMAPATHQGFATLSTDTGHNSSSQDLSWALDSPEQRTDWGWRALHGSVRLGKKLTEAFYGGERIRYSYYGGCSTGGRQGLKEVQMSPESFDGVLVGAPAWYTSHTNPYALRAGMYNLPVDDPGHIDVDLFPALAREVVRQCDGLDGLEDGIVSEPESCVVDFEKIECGWEGVNASACFTPAQADTARKIYADWRSEKTGELLHPGLSPSSEDQWWILFNGTEPSPFGVGYVRNFVLNDAEWDWRDFDDDEIVRRAEETDPGNATADRYDGVVPFRRRGGKLLMYHGTADGLVPMRGTTLYYERTRAAMRRYNRHHHHHHHHKQRGGKKKKNKKNSDYGDDDDHEDDLRDFMRLFLVPGMQHCAGTTVDAPWNFGAPAQAGALGTGEWSVPGFEDAEHDVLLALVDWVENGRAVDRIVATTWNQPANASSGVLRQRPLCAWPERAVWDGVGDLDVEGSWGCV